MPRRRTVSASLLAAVALAAAATRPSSLAAQQQADSGPVPRELVLALVSPYGGPWLSDSAPALLVGRAPAGLPAGVVPTDGGATVLGSVTHVRRGGPTVTRSTTVIVTVPATADSALAAYARALESAGWRRPVRPAWLAGGFLPPAVDLPTMLCRDSALVSVSTAPRRGGAAGSYLRIGLTSGERRGPCDEQPQHAPVIDDEGPPFPALRAPAEARVQGIGSNSSSSSGGAGARSREIRTLLATPMSVGSLVAHYAAQLRAAGWTVREVTANGDAAVQVVEVRDPRGRSWRGLLTAFAVPGAAEREVALQVARADDQ